MSQDRVVRNKDKLALAVSDAIKKSLLDENIGIDDAHNWGEQTAEEAGKGLHYFNNTDEIAYSNGEKWLIPTDVKVNKSKGVLLADLKNGLSSITISTQNAGATITENSDTNYILTATKSILLKQNTGRDVQNTVDVPLVPFLLKADSVITLVFYVKDPVAVNNIEFFLTTAAQNFTSRLTLSSESIVGTSVEPGGGWVTINFTGANLDAGFVGGDLRIGNTFDLCRIRFWGMTQGCEIYLDSVFLDASTYPTAVPISFDGNYISSFTEGYTYLSKKGIRGSMAVNTGTVEVNSSYVSKDQLKEMYDNGWDLLNNTHNNFFLTSGFGTFYGPGNVNNVAQSQTVAAGSNVVLNGAVGTSIFDTPRALCFYTTNDRAKRFIISGIDEHGVEVQETVISRISGYHVVGKTVWSKLNSIVATDGASTGFRIGQTPSYDEMYDQVVKGRNFLVANGWLRGSDIFVTPGGEYNFLAHRVIKDLGYRYVRSTAKVTEAWNLIPHSYGMPAYCGGIPGKDPEKYIAQKDLAKTLGQQGSMYFRIIVPDSTVTPAGSESRISDFRAVIDSIYGDIKTGVVFCPTYTEYARIFDDR